MAKLIHRTASVSNDAIKKRFNSYKPHQVISEYIWNGFDANATSIEVRLNYVDEEFKTISEIEILDNGDGINFQNPDQNFDRWDSSSKGSGYEKGSQGRGRFSFHKVSSKITWLTVHNNEHAKITAYSTQIPNYSIEEITEYDQNKTLLINKKGTSVRLSEIDNTQSEKIPTKEQLLKEFSLEFGWKLVINPNISLTVNGEKVIPQQHQLFEKDYEIENNVFNSKIIIWNKKPNKEKSYNYFFNSKLVQKHRDLTGVNYKDDFYLSGYIKSSWFDEFVNTNNTSDSMFGGSPSSWLYKALKKQLLSDAKDLYNQFIIDQADALVSSFEEEGFFPKYDFESPENTKARIAHTKNIIKSIHVADPNTFNGLKSKKHKKILVALLDKITVSNENDSLFDVLAGVLDLNKEKLDTLANQIKRSKLDNIISTISVLQKRTDVIQRLEHLFDQYDKEIKETPELQKIIEGQYWLFGPQYELIGAEEDDFQQTSKTLLRAITDKDEIEIEDLIDENKSLKDVRCQVDLFLARRKITYTEGVGQHYKCTIIEIKRPGISLNEKHLRQIEKYAQVLANHSGFNDSKMRFDVILVGRKLSKDDYIIGQRIEDNLGQGSPGLVFGKDSRIKGYVRTWAEIFNEFNITNSHLLSKLSTQRLKLESSSKTELLTELQ